MLEFLASWSLFGTTYVVGLASAALLSLVGVQVVAQDKIFLGAAVAQQATAACLCARGQRARAALGRGSAHSQARCSSAGQ